MTPNFGACCFCFYSCVMLLCVCLLKCACGGNAGIAAGVTVMTQHCTPYLSESHMHEFNDFLIAEGKVRCYKRCEGRITSLRTSKIMHRLTSRYLLLCRYGICWHAPSTYARSVLQSCWVAQPMYSSLFNSNPETYHVIICLLPG